MSNKPPSKRPKLPGGKVLGGLEGPWAHKSSHKQEDANPVAASSSDESDNEPQSAQPPPQPLSQPKSFGEAMRPGEWVKLAELVLPIHRPFWSGSELRSAVGLNR